MNLVLIHLAIPGCVNLHMRPSSSSMTSLHPIRGPSGVNAIVTADTDMRIRFWNLANALDSYIVHGSGSETVNQALRNKLVDGTVSGGGKESRVLPPSPCYFPPPPPPNCPI